MTEHTPLSRRELLFGFLGRVREAGEAGAARARESMARFEQAREVDDVAGEGDGEGDRSALSRHMAVIQGRRCFAYRGQGCSSCVEHCPEPEAIRLVDGCPQVVADHCTGCGDCADVCPAPGNAILMLLRPRPSMKPATI